MDPNQKPQENVEPTISKNELKRQQKAAEKAKLKEAKEKEPKEAPQTTKKEKGTNLFVCQSRSTRTTRRRTLTHVSTTRTAAKCCLA
jgi:hypothetical protein